jgi:4-aminobutyrate aminotransferase-like enzyme
VERLPFGCPVEAIERTLARSSPACVIVEPVVGREGVLFPPAGWLGALAAACRRHGVLLVADEIFTGFGRTGRWFAVDEEGVRPDLLICGKALGGGLPLAAVVGRRELMAAWDRRGEALHTSTFLASPLACAAALAALRTLLRERLLERMPPLAAALGERLAAWKRDFATVAAVRGRGLLWGVELKSARLARAWVRSCRERGVLLLAGGPQGNVGQLCPPFVITHFQLVAALDALEDALGAVAARRPSRRREGRR